MIHPKLQYLIFIVISYTPKLWIQNIGRYEFNHCQIHTGDIVPHFIIDCSQSILKSHSQEELIEQVHISAVSTKLFHKNDVKVRVNFFTKYSTGNKKEDFIHVFANIMEGRTIEQKANLSKTIVEDLSLMFPKVAHIGTNVIEFERATYFNRNMLDPSYQFSMP